MMRNIIYCVPFLGIISCASRLTSSQYLDYYDKNRSEFELLQQESSLTVKLRIQPIEYFVAKSEMEGVEASELKTYLKESSKELSSFSLQLNFNSGNLFNQDKLASSDKMRFYAVDFKKYIKAINISGDTLQCSNYIYQATSTVGGTAYFEFDIPTNINRIEKVFFYSPYILDSLIEMNTSVLRPKHPELKLR